MRCSKIKNRSKYNQQKSIHVNVYPHIFTKINAVTKCNEITTHLPTAVCVAALVTLPSVKAFFSLLSLNLFFKSRGATDTISLLWTCDILWYVMLCYVMRCYITLCYIMLLKDYISYQMI